MSALESTRPGAQSEARRPRTGGSFALNAVEHSRPWWRRWPTVGMGAYLLAYIAWTQIGGSGDRLRESVSAICFLLPPLLVVFLTQRNARLAQLPAAARQAWALFALGATVNFASSVLWALANLRAPGAPLPDWIDALALACTPLYVASILRFPVGNTRRARGRIAIDTALVLVAGGLAAWYLALRTAPPGSPTDWARLIAMAYPLADYLPLLALAAVLVWRPKTIVRQSLHALAASQAVGALADLLYASQVAHGGYRPGHLLDALWMAAWAFDVVAAEIQIDALARQWARRARERAMAANDAIGNAIGDALGDATGGDMVDNAAAARHRARAGYDESYIPHVVVGIGYAIVLLAAHPAWGSDLAVALGAAALLTALLTARHIAATRTNAELLRIQREQEDRYRGLFNRNPCPMWVFDVENGAIFDVNAAATRAYGYTRHEFLTMSVFDLRPDEDHDGFRRDHYLAAGHQGLAGPIVTRHRLRSGEIRDVEVTADGFEIDGREARLVLAMDVTDRRVLERELTRQAFHDPLTGLPNRALFRERVERALAARADASTLMAVLFLDLDDFKTANDSLGHAAGDRLLCAVAERLRSATRGSDTVARLGGDEFGVLLETVADAADVRIVVDRIQRALARPVGVDGHAVPACASIGVAFPVSDDTADTLLRNADVAMYSAKANGKGAAAAFEPAMHEALLQRITLEADLRAALAAAQFRLHYQPIVDLTTGRTTGAEALLRWAHPTRGPIAPLDFLPLAETTGLIVSIGAWVLRTACADAVAWPCGAGVAPSVSVNVSARQLLDPTLTAAIEEALAESGLPANRLIIEVTENVLIAQPDVALRVLQRLKGLGLRIAIDDFGTGYSSLAYLQRFPVDVLKIDKSFIDIVGIGPRDDALLRTIIELGHTLGLCTVAEGVEHSEQRQRLAALGCHSAQGDLFACPLPQLELCALWRGAAPELRLTA